MKVTGPVLRRAVLLVLLATTALVIGLTVTPKVPVHTFGQTVDVGAVSPGSSFGFSGPGQADLFGEGTIDTVQRFSGPIRPKIVWQRFERNEDASRFIQSTVSGAHPAQAGAEAVGRALADGWVRYFTLLLLVSGVVGGALYLAGVGVRALVAGPRRAPVARRHYLTWLGASIASTVLLTASLTALTAFSVVQQLQAVRSLSDLVGRASLAPVPAAAGAVRTDVDVAVIGDSTAAGLGNAPLDDPTREDEACQRSKDAYAAVLESASGVSVMNLACSGATISAGVLGSQSAGGIALPPQVGVLQQIPSARLVVVSVGANDVGWSDFVWLCYALPACDDRATERLFQSRLDAFKIQYAQLLQQLTDLPSHPAVLVNEYYDPFGSRFDCAALQDPQRGGPGSGFAATSGEGDQAALLQRKVEPLRSFLDAMNQVLSVGAKAFGFSVATPDFTGHELCSDQSWVQGVNDPAPLHPRAAGELAIAAADLPAVALLVDAHSSP